MKDRLQTSFENITDKIHLARRVFKGLVFDKVNE